MPTTIFFFHIRYMLCASLPQPAWCHFIIPNFLWPTLLLTFNYFPFSFGTTKTFFKVILSPKWKGINYNYNRQPVIMCKNMYKVSQISCCCFLLTRSIYIRWRSTYFLLQKLTFKLSKLVNSWGFSWLYISFIFNIPLQYDVLFISV